MHYYNMYGLFWFRLDCVACLFPWLLISSTHLFHFYLDYSLHIFTPCVSLIPLPGIISVKHGCVVFIVSSCDLLSFLCGFNKDCFCYLLLLSCNTHIRDSLYAHMKYKKQFINTTNEPVELPSFFWQIEKVTSGISLQNTVALLIMAVSHFICIQNA